jgi:hypothetical protein
VGKHEAADGSSIDPLIADALTHRPPETVGAPRHGAEPTAGEGEVGWPGEPPVDDDRVGWPERAPSAPVGPGGSSAEGTADVAAPAAPERAGPTARRGWRRLLAFSA